MFNRFRQFMYGRYGNDKLNIALLVLWMLLAFVNLFLRLNAAYYAVSLFFLLVIFYRMLSRDIERRYRENAWFERIWSRVKGSCRLQLLKIRQFRTHRFFKCPACRATVRIPRRTGKLTVTCTRCGHTFEKRIWF